MECALVVCPVDWVPPSASLWPSLGAKPSGITPMPTAVTLLRAVWGSSGVVLLAENGACGSSTCAVGPLSPLPAPWQGTWWCDGPTSPRQSTGQDQRDSQLLSPRTNAQENISRHATVTLKRSQPPWCEGFRGDCCQAHDCARDTGDHLFQTRSHSGKWMSRENMPSQGRTECGKQSRSQTTAGQLVPARVRPGPWSSLLRDGVPTWQLAWAGVLWVPALGLGTLISTGGWCSLNLRTLGTTTGPWGAPLLFSAPPSPPLL